MPTLTCAMCGHELEPPIEAHYVEVTAWERPGRGLNGRSGSSLVLREPTGRIACAECVTSRLAGIPVGQQELA